MATKASLHSYTVQEGINSQNGQAGYKIVASGANTGAAAAGIEYTSVTSLHAATTLTTTSNDSSGFPDYAAQVIPIGVTVYGRWATVAIAGTSGLAIVYRG
jgi:hypothetical protein